MTRTALVLALLVAAAPARSQTVPTPEQIDRMEAAVDRGVRDSTRARNDANRATSTGSQEERQEARRKVAEVNLLLADARDSLGRAMALVAASVGGDADRDAGDTTEVVRGTAEAIPETSGTAGDDGEGPWYTTWPVIALGVALLALAGAAAWWFTQRRGGRRSTAFAPQASRQASRGSDVTAQGLAQGLASPFVPQAQFDDLKRQVQTLQKNLDELRAWATDDFNRKEAARAAAAAPVPVAVPAAVPVALSPADAVAAAFADWCRRATPMMSRVDFFASDLAARVPGASARAVYRDLNSQAEPVRFDAAGGASPAEFWLVTAGSEALVFPQPLNAHQFRDLTRIFDGTATPATLGSIAPARVRDEGAAFALTAPGRVSGR